MDKTRRFTGRQLTTMVVAACIAVVAAPVGAMAATGSLINIADPANAAQVAHVDASGHLYVGDGSGALTVDGTVSAKSVTQTVVLWSYYLNGQNAYNTPRFSVAAYGQVRVGLSNASSGPCEVLVWTAGSQSTETLLWDTTLAALPYSPTRTSAVFAVPGRTLWITSNACQVDVEVYARA